MYVQRSPAPIRSRGVSRRQAADAALRQWSGVAAGQAAGFPSFVSLPERIAVDFSLPFGLDSFSSDSFYIRQENPARHGGATEGRFRRLERMAHTIRSSLIRWTLLGATTARGIDVDAVLARAGLPCQAELGNRRFPRDRYAALLRTLMWTMRDEFWGFCSKPVLPGTFSSTCRRLIHASSLREALDMGLSDYRRHIPDFVPRLHIDKTVAAIRLHRRGESMSYLNMAAQALFCVYTIQMIWWLTGVRIPLAEVSFRHSAPSDPPETGRFLRAPCRYGQQTAGFSFDSYWLDAPIMQTGESLNQLLRRVPEALLERDRETGGLVDQVQRHLRKNLSGPTSSFAETARALHMSESTLYRRIQQQGLSFQRMKDELRREVSIHYLATTSCSLSAIAQKTGFSELATFNRAFKKWTGMPPGAYRQRLAVSGPIS